MRRVEETAYSGPNPTPPGKSRWYRCVAVCSLALGALFPWTEQPLAQEQTPLQHAQQPRADDTSDSAEQLGSFTAEVAPFLATYCVQCHGKEVQEAKLTLARFRTQADLSRAPQIWDEIIERVEAGEMPPEDAEHLPTSARRRRFVDWLKRARDEEATENAGDPGPVLLRRLSNAEYDYTIRDLTGVDIQPTGRFPIDPGNEAGFDNSGESLTLSPALFEKYLAAARDVADHVVLTPDDLLFAPHPAVTHTDRDKFCVKRIIRFYERTEVDLCKYFAACFEVQQESRNAEHDVRQTARLSAAAERHGISPGYLNMVFELLTSEEHAYGPVLEIRQRFQQLTGETLKSGAAEMADFVGDFRHEVTPKVSNLQLDGSHLGSQPFVLWKNRQYSANRRAFNSNSIRDGDGPHGESEPTANEDLQRALTVPAGVSRQDFEAAVAEFCSVFPDAFVITERGRDYVDKSRADQEKGRLLSAGFHSMMGYYRDDRPLYDLVLNETQRQEIDRLWRELDFVAFAPQRQYVGFLWFERTDSRYMRDPEFDHIRAEDKSSQTEEKIRELSKLYLAKAERNGGNSTILQAIEKYFRDINQQIRWVEDARLQARNGHVEKVIDFADRAYRRPLSDDERRDLRSFYQKLIEAGLEHEDAIRDMVVSILMSPHFMLRTDMGGSGEHTRPLSSDELASRLAYFLWSSMPDGELRELAAANRLTDDATLKSQIRRMVRDRRIRGLAVEFAGNWLDFRRFESHNAVDRQRFPQFDDALRQAMYEEPIRYFIDMAQRDRPVTDLLTGRDTFVNGTLAAHYGIEGIASDADWQRVPDARRYGRGGLLPMSVFLTKNAPGLRTSPVKRGYWVARRLLGEHIPPPPPDVPEIPSDESQFKDRSLREVLEIHRQHPSCAPCHQRFDTMGLVFEDYGPIGERRSLDLAGRPVDVSAILPGDFPAKGVAGLQDYLHAEREDEFIDNLCRKFLAFALGRTLLRSDDTLILKMKENLAENDNRFSAMVETVVLSPQFRQKRARLGASGGH